MKYSIIDIKFDTDGKDIDLSTEMVIEVPDGLSSEETLDYISDKISDETGFCHLGFNTFPEII